MRATRWAVVATAIAACWPWDRPRPARTLFQNAAYASDYCDSTPTVGVFNLDSPTNACWQGYNPAIQVKATVS